MLAESKPIYGCTQYPHMGFYVCNNPYVEISQIIAYHLTELMATYPERETLAKVAKAAKVGFGTVQRAKNGDGNLTVQNLALIASAFKRRPEDFLIEPKGVYPPLGSSRPSIVFEPNRDEQELLHGYRKASEEVREIILELARKATKKSDLKWCSEKNN